MSEINPLSTPLDNNAETDLSDQEVPWWIIWDSQEEMWEEIEDNYTEDI